MMTQADILARNEENSTQYTSISNKPIGFDSSFPNIDSFNLSENSPIRPSKYFASDRLTTLIILRILFKALNIKAFFYYYLLAH
jgi:hypothetical protein